MSQDRKRGWNVSNTGLGKDIRVMNGVRYANSRVPHSDFFACDVHILHNTLLSRYIYQKQTKMMYYCTFENNKALKIKINYWTRCSGKSCIVAASATVLRIKSSEVAE